MTKERIESIRRIMLPFIAEKLKEIDYEGMGEFDAKEFTKDFNEILNLAEEALQQKVLDDFKTEVINLADGRQSMKVRNVLKIIDKLKAKRRMRNEKENQIL